MLHGNAETNEPHPDRHGDDRRGRGVAGDNAVVELGPVIGSVAGTLAG